jgi:hypothetical protein
MISVPIGVIFFLASGVAAGICAAKKSIAEMGTRPSGLSVWFIKQHYLSINFPSIFNLYIRLIQNSSSFKQKSHPFTGGFSFILG